MTNQIDSPDGRPRKDSDRPSPDVEQYGIDGQSDPRRQGARGEPHRRDARRSPGAANDQGYRGDDPVQGGLTRDQEPDRLARRGVSEQDHRAAGEPPRTGDQLSFDDDEIMAGRGNPTRSGGTWATRGSDGGEPGAPSTGPSDRNGPRGPDRDGKPTAEKTD